MQPESSRRSTATVLDCKQFVNHYDRAQDAANPNPFALRVWCRVERKFLRGAGKVGHIEDVVVDASARGCHLGQQVVRYLTDYAKEAGCYKVILDCSIELRSFYEKCGFEEKDIQMALYF